MLSHPHGGRRRRWSSTLLRARLHRGGRRAAEWRSVLVPRYQRLAEGKKLTIDARLVPYSVFTDPQLGRVGMAEREARAAKHRLKIGTIPMEYVARAIERDETAGLMKLVVDADSDRFSGRPSSRWRAGN